MTEYHASYGFMISLLRTSRAKLLGMPSFQPGTSKVEVWHQGLRASSVAMVWAKCSDEPLRGKAVAVLSMSCGWMRSARLRGR